MKPSPYRQSFKEIVQGIEVAVFEPAIKESAFYNARVIGALGGFKQLSDVIVANRCALDSDDVADKIHTRDLFGADI